MTDIFWLNLKAIIEVSGLTAAEVSRQMGHAPGYISQSMRAGLDPKLSDLVELSTIFNLSLNDWILRDTAHNYEIRKLEEEREKIERRLKDLGN